MSQFKTCKFTPGEIEVLMLVSKMKVVETPEGLKFAPRLFPVMEASAYNHLKNQAVPILKKYSDDRLSVKEEVKKEKFPEMVKLEKKRDDLLIKYEETHDEKLMEDWDAMNAELMTYEGSLEKALSGNEKLLELWKEEHPITFSENAYESLKEKMLSAVYPADFPALDLVEPLTKKFQ